MITLSCGHNAGDPYDGEMVAFGEEHCDAVDGFSPCVVYAEYCPNCAAKAREWPEFISNETEADDWLAGGDQYQRWRASAASVSDEQVPHDP